MRHLVLAFCTDPLKDPVASHVLDRLLSSGIPWQDAGGGHVDGHPVLSAIIGETRCHLLQLEDVLGHDYLRYAPLVNERFGDADAVVVVNWHEGRNAPDRIFTVQTTGDMDSGCFSPVDPALTRALFLCVEAERQRAGLDAYATWMEATHWSGPLYRGQPGRLLSELRPSVIDLEIGSTPEAWSDPAAADVLARALVALCASGWGEAAVSLLCVGGVHFEPGFTQPLRELGATEGLALSHVLPNHWLVAHGYDADGRLPDMLACARSIAGGVDAVVFHDNLKAGFKAQVRALATELGVPALSHRKLRAPGVAEAIRAARTAA